MIGELKPYFDHRNSGVPCLEEVRQEGQRAWVHTNKGSLSLTKLRERQREFLYDYSLNPTLRYSDDDACFWAKGHGGQRCQQLIRQQSELVFLSNGGE